MERLNMASLQKRTLSAVILAPIFIAIVWYGDWPLALWLVLASLIALQEWYNLIQKLNEGRIYALVAGVAYICVSFYSFFLCRELGGVHIILLLLMVWSSDIGAYFTGKIFGGPKLIPQVSPNKTWAGLGGALLSPALVLIIFMIVTDDVADWSGYVLALLLVLGSILGLLGQIGDLLISYVKRQAKVKDTGHLIPGHGGLLDRIDSLLLVTPVFYVLIKYFIIIMSET